MKDFAFAAFRGLWTLWEFVKMLLVRLGAGSKWVGNLLAAFVDVSTSIIKSTFFVRLAIFMMAGFLMLASFSIGHKFGYRHVKAMADDRDAAMAMSLNQQSEVMALKAKIAELQKVKPAQMVLIPEKKSAPARKPKAKPVKKAASSLTFF